MTIASQASAVVEFRFRAGLKQADIARELGVTTRHVNRLERGRTPIKRAFLLRLEKLMRDAGAGDLALIMAVSLKPTEQTPFARLEQRVAALEAELVALKCGSGLRRTA